MDADTIILRTSCPKRVEQLHQLCGTTEKRYGFRLVWGLTEVRIACLDYRGLSSWQPEAT